MASALFSVDTAGQSEAVGQPFVPERRLGPRARVMQPEQIAQGRHFLLVPGHLEAGEILRRRGLGCDGG